MAELRDVIAYICETYPKKDDLSKARLTKMIYLADWESAAMMNKQITDIDWFFHQYGPYVYDVVTAIEKDEHLRIKKTRNAFGYLKEVVEVEGRADYPSLDLDDISILDIVIEGASNKTWDAFIKYVYATYPVANGRKFQPLDLLSCAKDADLSSS